MKTDLELHQDVLTELSWDPAVDATHIDVQVHDGVVTLAGHVASLSEKWSAGLAVQRVAGVRALSVELAVMLPGAHQRSDADIARLAQAALAWTRKVPGVELQVLVEDGWITLAGTAPSVHQRQAALSAVRHIVGVAGVSERIVLAPAASVAAVKADIKAEIEAAFKRLALANAAHAEVAARGGELTPGATLHRWSERHPARDSTRDSTRDSGPESGRVSGRDAVNGAERDLDGARGSAQRQARAPADPH
jgi:osmotically-inducible protein OsmY